MASPEHNINVKDFMRLSEESKKDYSWLIENIKPFSNLGDKTPKHNNILNYTLWEIDEIRTGKDQTEALKIWYGVNDKFILKTKTLNYYASLKYVSEQLQMLSNYEQSIFKNSSSGQKSDTGMFWAYKLSFGEDISGYSKKAKKTPYGTVLNNIRYNIEQNEQQKNALKNG